MANQWFRLYSEFAYDQKVQMLSESYQRRLVMLFCIRCNGSVTLQDEEVTFLLRISNEEWQQTKAIFVDKGFINSHNEIVNWDKRQFISDSSAERVARHRERKKRECNVTVTPPEQNRTEQNREILLSSSDDDSDVKHKKLNGVPYTKIVDLYHEVLPKCPRVASLTSKRKGQIGARWNSALPDLETWKEYFIFCSQSSFLMGKVDPSSGHKRFIADIEWLTNETNFTKVWEGKYHGK